VRLVGPARVVGADRELVTPAEVCARDAGEHRVDE
jgi:hypothetical protein